MPWTPWGLAVLLAACGGGSGGDAPRSGVTVEQPLSVSAQAVAPREDVTYRARCRGSGEISYEWDAGDGREPTRGRDDHVVLRYTGSGRDLPRVTCRDATGASATSAAGAHVQVAVPPQAFAWVRAEADGTDADVQARCLADPGTVLAYAWDFGDGSTGSGASASHRYADGVPGPYVITAKCTAPGTLTDLAGRSLPAPQTVTATTTVLPLALQQDAAAVLRITEPLAADPPLPNTQVPVNSTLACASSASGSTIMDGFDLGDGEVRRPLQCRTQYAFAPDGAERAAQHTVRATCSGPDGQALVQTLLLNVRTPLRSLLAGGVAGARDGLGAEASFAAPAGLAAGREGETYVADTGNHAIRKVTPEGRGSTLAGAGRPGYADGRGDAALFDQPMGIAVDADGNLLVADSGNHSLRIVSPQGTVATLAGNGSAGHADAAGSAASFNFPVGLAMGADSSVFVADSGNHVIRKTARAGLVSTVAASPGPILATSSPHREPGMARGARPCSTIPLRLAVDGVGNLYVVEEAVAIRKVSPAAIVSSLPDIQAVAGLASASGPASGIALSGRRLVLSRGVGLAQIDSVP